MLKVGLPVPSERQRSAGYSGAKYDELAAIKTWLKALSTEGLSE